jgi:hypothetical protein
MIFVGTNKARAHKNVSVLTVMAVAILQVVKSRALLGSQFYKTLFQLK